MMLLGQNNQSSMVNFAQIPVTNEVKLKQNFDLLSNLLIGTSGKGSHSIVGPLYFLSGPSDRLRFVDPTISCHAAQLNSIFLHCCIKWS